MPARIERTAEYRGCRIDASVSVTSGPMLSTAYQVTPLTEEAKVVFGAQWKGVASAGTKTLRDIEKSGGPDPMADAIAETLEIATNEIDLIFRAAGPAGETPGGHN